MMIDYETYKTEHITLNNEKMERLKELISIYISKYGLKKNIIRKNGSSYYLKHVCERLLGHYISNMDLKEAMKQLNVSNNTVLNKTYHDENLNIYYPFFKKMIIEMDNDSRNIEKVNCIICNSEYKTVHIIPKLNLTYCSNCDKVLDVK